MSYALMRKTPGPELAWRTADQSWTANPDPKNHKAFQAVNLVRKEIRSLKNRAGKFVIQWRP